MIFDKNLINMIIPKIFRNIKKVIIMGDVVNAYKGKYDSTGRIANFPKIVKDRSAKFILKIFKATKKFERMLVFFAEVEKHNLLRVRMELRIIELTLKNIPASNVEVCKINMMVLIKSLKSR